MVWCGSYVHNNLTQLMKSFNYDARKCRQREGICGALSMLKTERIACADPMGMFISVMAGMSTFHPEANPSLTSVCFLELDFFDG